MRESKITIKLFWQIQILSQLSKAVKKENTVEVIDHHNRESWLDENPNLKIQIELIGAAATLVAERFKN